MPIVPQTGLKSSNPQNRYQKFINWMGDTEVAADIFFGFLQALLLSAVKAISPWLVPLTPAIFVGFEIYAVAIQTMPMWLALPAAMMAAFGLEAVGASVSHTTLELYAWRQRNGRGGEKVLLGAVLVLAYAAAALLVVIYLKTATLVVVGSGAVVLTLITYIGQALSLDVRQAIAQEQKVEGQAEAQQAKLEAAQEAERQRQLEAERETRRQAQQEAQRQAELAHQQELARIEADAQVAIEKAKAEEGRKAAVAKAKVTQVTRPSAQGDKMGGTNAHLNAPSDTVTRPSAQVGGPVTAHSDTLTDRQAHILSLLGEGMSRSDIADEIGTSRRTVYRELKKMNGIVKDLT